MIIKPTPCYRSELVRFPLTRCFALYFSEQAHFGNSLLIIGLFKAPRTILVQQSLQYAVARKRLPAKILAIFLELGGSYKEADWPCLAQRL